jgi:hypothetical protein
MGMEIGLESPVHGEIEIDESYFGGKRKGARSLCGTITTPRVEPALRVSPGPNCILFVTPKYRRRYSAIPADMRGVSGTE